MSQLTYRGNLSAKSFPFLAENFGRSVIVRQYDNNYSRALSAESEADVGIPQFYYAHNVMPKGEGLQSVGFTQIIAGALTDITQIELVRDAAGSKVYLSITSDGKFYSYVGGSWHYLVTLVGTVTFAYVSGVNYIYISGIGCYTYEPPSGPHPFGRLVIVALTGTVIVGVDAVEGICASYEYLVVWSANKVFWSSTLSATDFTPSLITGAGNGAVVGAKGNIIACVAHLLGFIVYTDNNAVAALYSGNSRYPFNFREIVSSGGISSILMVATDASTGNHYAYTTSGLQLISTSQAQVIYPDATDFIAGKLLEDFNEITNQFTYTTLSSTMQKRVNVISERYLVISYGIAAFTHAIIFDLGQKRWGKVKLNHTSTFEFEIPISGVTEIPRQSIAFLQADGSVQILDFDTNRENNGVLILGKFQYVRTRLLALDTIDVENVKSTAGFSIVLQSTLDGKNFTNSSPTLIYSSGELRRYGSDKIGLNHSLVCKGQFNLNSFVLTFHVHGKY